MNQKKLKEQLKATSQEIEVLQKRRQEVRDRRTNDKNIACPSCKAKIGDSCVAGRQGSIRAPHNKRINVWGESSQAKELEAEAQDIRQDLETLHKQRGRYKDEMEQLKREDEIRDSIENDGADSPRTVHVTEDKANIYRVVSVTNMFDIKPDRHLSRNEVVLLRAGGIAVTVMQSMRSSSPFGWSIFPSC